MRTTNDPKEMIIKARVNREIYLWLTNKSIKDNKTKSDIIRDIIAKEMLTNKS